MFITKGIDSDCFAEMREGKKTYELRLGDFPGRAGDVLALREKGADGNHTGQVLAYQITYASTFRLDALPWPREEVDRLGIALMSIDPIGGARQDGDVPLKAWPRYFEEVFVGRKRFEFRLGDRLYPPGTVLRLEEWDPDAAPPAYTGRYCRVRVTQSRRWSLAELGRFWPPAEIEEKGLCAISLCPLDAA